MQTLLMMQEMSQTGDDSTFANGHFTQMKRAVHADYISQRIIYEAELITYKACFNNSQPFLRSVLLDYIPGEAVHTATHL